MQPINLIFFSVCLETTKNIFSAFFWLGAFKKSLSKLKSKSLFRKPAVLVQKSFTPWGVNSTLAETPPLHTHRGLMCDGWGWRRLLCSLNKWRGRSFFLQWSFWREIKTLVPERFRDVEGKLSSPPLLLHLY